MAPASGKIQDYFQRVPSSTKPATEKNVTEVPLEPQKGSHQASQQVIRSSDDEESDSDSSLEDLADMLKFQSATQRPISTAANGFESPKISRLRNRGKPLHVSVSPGAVKPKLMFDMKMLVDQAKKSEATEASALRLQALLDNTAGSTQDPQSRNSRSDRNEILESVVAGQEGASVEQVLRAVKRTEATHANKRWEFFAATKPDNLTVRHFPYDRTLEGWKADLADPNLREQLVLSGFARDMVALGDAMPDELFLWILDEICLERREDLREAYIKILLASHEQIRQAVRPETIVYLFRKLGAKEEASDINVKVRSVAGDHTKSDDQDWTIMRNVITFIGRISEYLSVSTCSSAFCVLARLCIDDVVLENIGLLAATQETIEMISRSIRGEHWQKTCPAICRKLFDAVDEATLRFQMLRCLPITEKRVHELRRRLALAFFFNDVEYIGNAPQNIIDLSDIRTRLEQPQFNIDKETNYSELAAMVSILDMAIDDGQSTIIPLTDPEAEQEFNTEVDALAARVYIMWSHISDAGASFMSRIDAKEVLESLRQRLLYAVRTKPKPKKGIFDSTSDNPEVLKKQSEFMKKHFKKEAIDNVR